MILKEYKPKQKSGNYKIDIGNQNEKDAAYYIDFEFRNTKNYIVLHNLKFKYKGRTAQIDHLIIGRIGIFVLAERS